nr:hypothetical protein GCM10020063_016790 [Dactylosporangium thailandense]
MRPGAGDRFIETFHYAADDIEGDRSGCGTDALPLRADPRCASPGFANSRAGALQEPVSIGQGRSDTRHFGDAPLSRRPALQRPAFVEPLAGGSMWNRGPGISAA